MTHPGMAFVLIVGVGLATILYYMFADSNNSHNNQHNNDGYCYGGSPEPTNNNSWTSNSDRPRRRRKESSAGNEKPSCTICLNEIGVQQMVYVLPCSHPFHKSCIEKWRDQRQLEGHNCCPNCRKKIEHVC